MKKLITSVVVITAMIFAQTANAQVSYPAPSPQAKIHQVVGSTDVKVEYSRPSRKGRTLFVDVEKYGSIWRTGANSSTKISFSDDVSIEGKAVPAGQYAIYSIPGETEWSVMLYKDLSIGGNVGAYDEANELIRVKVQSTELPMSIENFTIDIGNITNNSATIALIWGNHYVPVNMTVDTDSKVMAQIEEAMKNPMASVGNNYAQAANYYLQNDKDLDKALEWMTKATEINPNAFWHMQSKARILAKMENYKGAVTAAKKSLEVAKAAQNDFGFIESNEKLISEWSKK